VNDYQRAILLSIVEGLTEFIPVSSTGHLILVGNWLDFVGERANTFEIFIQLGAILAVFMLYGHRFLALFPRSFRDFFPGSGTGFSGGNGLWKLALGCLPAFIAGALFHSKIKELLFHPEPVAYALITGGLIMIVVEIIVGRRHHIERIEDVSFWKFFVIGVCQCAALWPGMSRAASTIVPALCLGCSRRVSAEVSFFLAVPIIAAASLFDLLKNVEHLHQSDTIIFAIGFFGAFITAIIAIKGFLALLEKLTLAPFGLYRILLGAYIIWSLN
jgi:undecaprenyl-diphosphatase